MGFKYVYVSVYVCRCIYVYICTFINVYVCICVCMFIFTLFIRQRKDILRLTLELLSTEKTVNVFDKKHVQFTLVLLFIGR